jgi:hypothetical protein
VCLEYVRVVVVVVVVDDVVFRGRNDVFKGEGSSSVECRKESFSTAS